MERPELDNQQDWVVVMSAKNNTHTSLKFHRGFDTGDSNDDVIFEVSFHFNEVDTHISALFNQLHFLITATDSLTDVIKCIILSSIVKKTGQGNVFHLDILTNGEPNI